jgi:hypothetical protein
MWHSVPTGAVYQFFINTVNVFQVDVNQVTAGIPIVGTSETLSNANSPVSYAGISTSALYLSAGGIGASGSIIANNFRSSTYNTGTTSLYVEDLNYTVPFVVFGGGTATLGTVTNIISTINQKGSTVTIQFAGTLAINGLGSLLLGVQLPSSGAFQYNSGAVLSAIDLSRTIGAGYTPYSALLDMLCLGTVGRIEFAYNTSSVWGPAVVSAGQTLYLGFTIIYNNGL